MAIIPSPLSDEQIEYIGAVVAAGIEQTAGPPMAFTLIIRAFKFPEGSGPSGHMEQHTVCNIDAPSTIVMLDEAIEAARQAGN